MACTYSSVEIQRSPELRVLKKCMFFDKPCAEIRAAKKCPLINRATRPAERPTPTSGRQTGYSDVLNEELQKFESIPAVGGEFKSGEEAAARAGRAAEKPQVTRGPSDAELLEAELSDFMDKFGAKSEKMAEEAAGRPPVTETKRSSTKTQTAARRKQAEGV
ncbi:MAG: hypothetical protein WED05_01060 [Candidatus Atabeyarchaeum deiterrae]